MVKRFRNITRQKNSGELAIFAADMVRGAIVEDNGVTADKDAKKRFKYNWTLSLHGENPVSYPVCKAVFCYVWGFTDYLVKQSVEVTKNSANGMSQFFILKLILRSNCF